MILPLGQKDLNLNETSTPGVLLCLLLLLCRQYPLLCLVFPVPGGLSAVVTSPRKLPARPELGISAPPLSNSNMFNFVTVL